jgi:D-galactarolactone cycloisomerase
MSGASLPVYPHSSNIPRPNLVEYDLGSNPLRDSILRNPLAQAGGVIVVPDAPGLGIEIDWNEVERHVLR